MHIIPEEASEEDEKEEESKIGSPDEDSNEISDEDVENLLAPQELSEKKEWVFFYVSDSYIYTAGHKSHLISSSFYISSEKRTWEQMSNPKVQYRQCSQSKHSGIHTTNLSFKDIDLFFLAMCDNVEIFQVELDKSTKSDHPSDSEFDDFYA